MTAVMVPVEKDIFSVTKTPYICVEMRLIVRDHEDMTQVLNEFFVLMAVPETATDVTV